MTKHVTIKLRTKIPQNRNFIGSVYSGRFAEFSRNVLGRGRCKGNVKSEIKEKARRENLKMLRRYRVEKKGRI